MKALKPFVVVVNPSSGEGRGQALLDEMVANTPSVQVLSKDVEAGEPVTWPVLRTTKDGAWKHELEVQLRGRNAQGVVAIGGDGTLMEVAQVLEAAKRPAGTLSLVPVPGGRGNDFVRGLNGYSLKDGAYWAWASKRKRWQKRPLDLASANGKVFINVASVGYGGRVVEKAHNRNAFWSRSSLVYQVEGALALMESGGGKVEIKVDGASIYAGEFFGAFIGNGKANGSGLFWMPEADTGDGRLDGIAFPRPGVLEMLKTMNAIKERKPPALRHTSFRGESIVMHFDRQTPLELDGDYVGSGLHHEFRCLKGALSVWTPGD